MTFSLNTKSAFAAAVVLAASAVFAGQASAGQFRAERVTPPPSTFGFASAGGGSSTGYVEHCNNVASCNLMIAYCIGHGGDWKETGHNGQGQPSSGSCTYPD